MRVYKKKKMATHYRYPSYIQLWKLLEEVREPVEVEEGIVEERVTGYYHDRLELPHRAEFDQLREVDEEGVVIVEDYITENYESLLEEARRLELEGEIKKLEAEIARVEKLIEEAEARFSSREKLGMYTTDLETERNTLVSQHSDLCYELSELPEQL